jgi:hypothetical protein
MNAVIKINKLEDRKNLLSALWIFLAANYIYCDHLSVLEPGTVNGLMTGHIGSIQVTQGFLLSAALIIEIPILMIVLARVLKYRVNRWVNIIVGVLMVVIQIGSMGFGTSPTLVYLSYSILEVVVNLLIVWLALKWRNPESTSEK